MPHLLGLPPALIARGLTVELAPGWETRGSASFNPKAAVCHWTAGPTTGDRRSLLVCINGRRDLPGPLCNVFLTRSGVAVVVAAGRPNHAGQGGWRGVTGNSGAFGTEAENSGSGDWTDAQRWAFPRINAAYCDLGGFGAEMVCGHHEWALPQGRKIDIRDWPMPAMRDQVAAVLGGRTPPREDQNYMANLSASDEAQLRHIISTEMAKVIDVKGLGNPAKTQADILRSEGVSGAGDIQRMGKGLAPFLVPVITEHLEVLTDGDVARLAEAAADEADRRTRERLGDG